MVCIWCCVCLPDGCCVVGMMDAICPPIHYRCALHHALLSSGEAIIIVSPQALVTAMSFLAVVYLLLFCSLGKKKQCYLVVTKLWCERKLKIKVG